MFFNQLLQANLKTKDFGRAIEYYPTTLSTNQDAWELISDDCTHGTIVVTDNQRSGKGRHGNEWFSSPNKSLTFSIILQIKSLPQNIGLLSILSSISIVDGIEQLTAIKCGVKWPNDIILNNRKVGGILIETKKNVDNFYIVIGMGINVNENIDDMYHDIKETGTSLKIVNNTPIQREQLLASILNILEKRFLSPWENNIKDWEKKCVHFNKNISFKYNKRKNRDTGW